MSDEAEPAASGPGATALVLYRVAFGLLMAGNAARYLHHDWPRRLYGELDVRFPFPAFAWLPAPSGDTAETLFIVVLLSALGIAAGAFYRISVAVFIGAFGYLQVIERTTYLNHYYLVCLLAFAMLFMPLADALSVDAWRRGQRAIPVWPVRHLRAQIGLVYVLAGMAKLDGDWLLRAQPLQTWLGRHADAALIGPLLDAPSSAYIMSWSGLVFDLGIVAFLLVQRTRRWAYAALVAFHVTTAALFPIGVFPWLMIAATPIFFAPDWPTEVVARSPRRTGLAGSGPTGGQWHTKLSVAFLAAQLLIAGRPYLLGGNLYWHEVSYRFGFRVMAAEKVGHLELHMRPRSGGPETLIDPRAYLTPRQRQMVVTNPELIVAFAHELAARAPEPVEVRADAWVMMNGHPRRRILDRGRDLVPIVGPRALHAAVCAFDGDARDGCQ